MKVLKNVINVALSNIASFGTSFIIGFILPAVLSLAEYGYYKEYTLYLSFAYLFNFGFNDGIYIKYGGKDQEMLDSGPINEEHNFVFVFQLVVMIIMISFSIMSNSIILGLFSIATFFVTLNTYHQNFLQAVGEFNIYSKGNIYKSIVYVVILLISILVLKKDDYVYYIVLNIISFLYLFLFYEWKRKDGYGISFNWNILNKGSLFKIGIFILLANMSLTFVGNVGNWVVNFGFTIEAFAQYSFQNSILNVILLIINAVGMVFYNVLSKNNSKFILKIIKELSLFLGILSGAAFFIFAVIIEKFLPAYIPAISYLSMTFIAIPYIMVSKILIANLYKVTRSEKKYFGDSLLYALMSVLFVVGVYLITNNIMAIALATSFCYIFWYMYTINFEYKFLKGGYKETLLMISHLVWFYICSNVLSNFIGFIGYLFYLVVILVLYKNRFITIKTEYFSN